VRIGYPVALICFLLARPVPWSLACGAALVSVGLAIRALAAGYLRKHESLATAGPYAWSRNPLYFGSMFLAAGFLLAAASWPAAALAIVYLAVFYPGVIRREEEELRAEYDGAFEEYARRVPLFWPHPPRQKTESTEKFSWGQYCRNREYQALIGTLVAFGILIARMMWRNG
jgi:protein-S-isoprenylcysteine O-methyltransferase Ste14